jgi:hypothetical protein
MRATPVASRGKRQNLLGSSSAAMPGETLETGTSRRRLTSKAIDCTTMTKPRDAPRLEIHGTLDMLILRTLQCTPHHGHGFGLAIRVLQALRSE